MILSLKTHYQTDNHGILSGKRKRPTPFKLYLLITNVFLRGKPNATKEIPILSAFIKWSLTQELFPLVGALLETQNQIMNKHISSTIFQQFFFLFVISLPLSFEMSAYLHFPFKFISLVIFYWHCFINNFKYFFE